MISTDDLRAAVVLGIVTEEQTAQLLAFAEARWVAKDVVGPVEKPYVLLKGFNEVFVVVGLVILFTGWVGVAVLFGLNMAAPGGATTVLLALLTLGAQWDWLGGRILAALPDFPGKSSLPPYAVQT